MEYSYLGKSGIQVSKFSFGSWVTFAKQYGVSEAMELIKYAYDKGVNFFDNAESYEGGQSEALMGEALRKLGLRRGSFLVSTKFFWGLHDGPNEVNTLNRKRLMEAIDGSLKRFGFDYIDIVYCHRHDPHTPIEEIARAMNDMIVQGKACYWGTSEWEAADIQAAWAVCDKYGWHKPIVEQTQYNIFVRDKVDLDYKRLYEDCGLGLTTFSPLASGLLTGKYNNGVPEGSRFSLPGYEWLRDSMMVGAKIETIKKLATLADEIGVNMAQFAVAWAASNPNVSTVILGASKLSQLEENLKALDVIAKITPEIKERVNEITGWTK